MKPRGERATALCVVPTADGPVMIPYVLRRSPRSRYLRLNLEPGACAVLTVPRHVSEGEAIGFLKERGEWLQSRPLRGRRSERDLFRYLLKQGFLSVHGRRVRLTMRFTREAPALHFDRGCNRVAVSVNSRASINRQLRQLLKDFAKEVVTERACQVAEKIGAQFHRVSIRDQRRCWGSCSENQTISLNWRLLLLAPELQDYILYHELAHLTHLNHSDAYWALLREYDRNDVRHDHRIGQVSSVMLTYGRS